MNQAFKNISQYLNLLKIWTISKLEQKKSFLEFYI